MFVAKIPSDGGGANSTGAKFARATDLSELLAATTGPEVSLPCQGADADLWFAEHPEQLSRAQARCRTCPIRQQCLAGALRRREPWGVWGGEILDRGRVVPFKRGRGRPSKRDRQVKRYQRTVA